MWIFIKNTTNSLFTKHLLATNIISSGVLMSIGDFLSQTVEKREHSRAIDDGSRKVSGFDWERNAKMFVVGAVQGPLHHYFYGWLDRTYIGATLKTTTIKILYDQFIMSPVCIAAFFYSAGWMYYQSNEQITKEIKSKFVTVYITDWMVWPATQFINFYYLHPKYRVIYVNFITMLYNVFLSHIKHDRSFEKASSAGDTKPKF